MAADAAAAVSEMTTLARQIAVHRAQVPGASLNAFVRMCNDYLAHPAVAGDAEFQRTAFLDVWCTLLDLAGDATLLAGVSGAVTKTLEADQGARILRLLADAKQAQNHVLVERINALNYHQVFERVRQAKRFPNDRPRQPDLSAFEVFERFVVEYRVLAASLFPNQVHFVDFTRQHIAPEVAKLRYEDQYAFFVHDQHGFDTCASQDAKDFRKRQLLGSWHHLFFEQTDIVDARVILTGPSGIGKSALINEILNLQGDQRCLEMHPRAAVPVGGVTNENTPKTGTCNIDDVDRRLTLVDTPGLELTDDPRSLETVGHKILDLITADPPVDLVWYCLPTETRIQPYPYQMIRMIGAVVPVIVVIPRATLDVQPLVDLLQGAELELAQVVHAYFPVVARDITLGSANEAVMQPHNLGALLRTSANVISQSRQERANMPNDPRLRENFVRNRRTRAWIIINACGVLAASTAAVPIPFLNAALFAPVLAGMLAGLCRLYGFHITRTVALAIVGPLIGTLLRTLTTVGITWAVVQFGKLIPGVNFIAMGVDATLGYTLSLITGASFKTALEQLVITRRDGLSGIDTEELRKAIEQQLMRDAAGGAREVIQRANLQRDAEAAQQ